MDHQGAGSYAFIDHRGLGVSTSTENVGTFQHFTTNDTRNRAIYGFCGKWIACAELAESWAARRVMEESCGPTALQVLRTLATCTLKRTKSHCIVRYATNITPPLATFVGISRCVRTES